MTTLKEDSSSWRSHGIIRSDFRHTKGDPEIPRHRKSAKKKSCSPRHKHEYIETSRWTSPYSGTTFITKKCLHCDRKQ